MTRTPIILISALLLMWCAPARADGAVKDRVFDPTCVSSISITAPEASIANLYAAPKGDYQPVALTFDLCGEGEDVFGPLNVSMRLKGSGSFRTLDGKAALRVKLPSGQRIDGIKNLTLNNMVQDASMVHEALAYEAFRAVGVKASRTGYATVTLNGMPYGLYANVETLDSSFLAANFAATQHLYEGPAHIEHPTFIGRDIVPGSVEHFEVDEGDDDDLTDLEAAAAIAELVDDGEWWTAFQQVFAADDVLRFWAAERFLGQWDGYTNYVNNFYLHSDLSSKLRFLPWGTDQAFGGTMGLDPSNGVGVVFDRCMGHPPCAAAYRAALNDVAEDVIALDLVSRAHQLQATIDGAVAADPRKEFTTAQQCPAVDATIGFLIDREALWSAQYRSSGSGIDSAQSSARLICPTEQAADPTPKPPGTKQPLAGGGVSINGHDRFTRNRRVRLWFEWPEDAVRVEVSNRGDFKRSVRFGGRAKTPWWLPERRGSRQTHEVFVRFIGGDGTIGPVVSDRIVLIANKRN